MQVKADLKPSDFHVAVRRRVHTLTPWRWEIYAAGRSKPVQNSREYFPTVSEVMKEGKEALQMLLRKRFPDAA
jgi:hypothetical protein